MTASEQDMRVEILNTLLTTPHRALEKVWPVHQELIDKDPRFYVRLAAWYHDQGDVRDHKEMFISIWCCPSFRDTATWGWPCCAVCLPIRWFAWSTSSPEGRRRAAAQGRAAAGFGSGVEARAAASSSADAGNRTRRNCRCPIRAARR